MRVVIDVDERSIRETQQRLGDFERRAPSAISNALNRGMANVNTNIKREVRKEYHIRAGDVNATLTKIRASRGSLSAGVLSKGHLIGLDKFKISPKTVNPKRKTPITAAVKKSGGGKLGSAFPADINGMKIFRRSGKSRLPINRLFGPSVPQMLDNEGMVHEIERQGQETFEKRLDHEINRILEGGRSRK